MDWSTITAASVGGTIGIVAEASVRWGQRGEKRHEVRDERARTAVEQILQAFVDNPVPLVAEDDEIRAAALNIAIRIYVSRLLLLDRELRRRLEVASSALDLAASAAFPGYRVSEVVSIVRSNSYRWLGSYLRDESLETPGADWTDLEAALWRAESTWYAELKNKGINIRPRDSPTSSEPPARQPWFSRIGVTRRPR